MFRCNCKRYRFIGLATSVLIIVLVAIIPVRMAIAAWVSPMPTAIFVLGGEPEREKFTAQFAQNHPSLPIWISSGSPPEYAKPIFQAAKISDQLLHFDYNAIDTVTNFTTTVDDFKKFHIQHLYLITSDFHMRRARAIATLVLGSQGITFTPVSIPANRPQESWLRIVRDSCRALLWIVSDRTGASLNPRSKHAAPTLLEPE